MSMTSESDEKVIPNHGVDSPSTDDASSGGVNVENNGSLKKGPWTSAEDVILVEYVTKHGEGNWNAVQKHSGLARCGKSCRLRWANHLRPDLKKGAFTHDEERRIIELHSKMGNKWARMAAELPGRTDNEIKNFWNTRIKRRQRAGLPIYPPEICLQESSNNPQTDDMNTLSPDNAPRPDFMPVNDFIRIPPVEFKGLQLDHQYYAQALVDMNPTPTTDFFDVPSSGLLPRNFVSSYRNNKNILPTSHPSKRLRGSDLLFQTPNAFASESPLYQSDCSEGQICNYLLRPDSTSNFLLQTTPNAFELPSLQTQTGNKGGSPSSPLPFFEPFDILIQTPPTEHGSSCSRLSPQNSGLLEEVLYESEIMKNSNGNAFFGNLPGASNMGNDEEVSTFGHSPSSVFGESNPVTPVSGNSFDGPRSDENLTEVGSNLQYDDEVDMKNQVIFSRPDYLLASSYRGPMKCPATDGHFSLENVMGKLIGDDRSRDWKQMNTGPGSSTQARGLNSCAWNAMRIV